MNVCALGTANRFVAYLLCSQFILSVYTLDTEYKNDLLTQLDKAYQVRKLFSKPEVRDFSLTKEMRNLDIDSGIGEREMLRKVYDHFKEKYHLGTKMADNRLALESAGYNFSHDIDTRIIRGEFRTTGDLSNCFFRWEQAYQVYVHFLFFEKIETLAACLSGIISGPCFVVSFI